MHQTTHAGRTVELRQVLPEADGIGLGEFQVSGCCSDVRQMQSGDLFVALPGNPDDPSPELAEAVARGCAAILADRPLGLTSVPVCYVPDARDAYGRICHALAGSPCERIKVLGVTGTRGKTTTVHLLASVLSAGGLVPGLASSLGCFDGEEFRSPGVETEGPKQLAATLARMADGGCSHAVVEVPARALEQSVLAGATLDAVCVTNIRPSLRDMPRTGDCRANKSRIFGYLAGEGLAVLNADDAASSSFLHQLGLPVLTIGLRADAEVTGLLLDRCPSEQTFLLTAGSEAVPVRTRIVGEQHLYNCLMAAAVGLAYGIDLPRVARGLETVERLPSRMERLECGQPFAVFVDSARTPEDLAQCLQTLREVTAGRLICLIGAEGERAERSRLAGAAEAGADVVVVTAPGRRASNSSGVIADLLEGLLRPEDAEIVADRTGAIYWALSQARPGDCVLLAGQADRGPGGAEALSRDDIQVAREWLYQYQPYHPSTLH